MNLVKSLSKCCSEWLVENVVKGMQIHPVDRTTTNLFTIINESSMNRQNKVLTIQFTYPDTISENNLS